MRLFDLIGALTVVAWCVVVGAYAYSINFGEPAADPVVHGVVLVDGDSWMILTRDEDEVGFMHETRSRLDDGWLLEYELLMNVSSLGVDQLIRTEIKATVDQSAVLRKVTGSVITGVANFDFEARVEGKRLIVSHDLGGGDKERTIVLKSEPRLSNSAFNQLAAMTDLEPGRVLEQEYFDPVFMDMRSMRFEFVREHKMKVYDEEVDAFHFKQKLSSEELDVYIDSRGEVQIQELPFRMVAARIPSSIGRSRSRALENSFTQQGKKRSKGEGLAEMSLEEAYSILGGQESLGTDTNFVVTGIPETLAVFLDSGAQKAVLNKPGKSIINTSVSAEFPAPSDGLLESLSTSSDAAEALLEKHEFTLGAEMSEATDVQKVERLARIVRAAFDSVEPSPPFALWGPNEKRRNPRPETAEVGAASLAALEYALSRQNTSGDDIVAHTLLVQAIRAQGIPARFVMGFAESAKRPEEFVPRVWVQFYDGARFVDLDLARTTLLPGTGQLQITLRDHLFGRNDLLELEGISIERVDKPSGSASDFD